MSIQKFESSILRIRDILRREGITGMDSMKHCTLYIAAKYMNRKRCEELGIPDVFCWESLLALVRESSNPTHDSKQYSCDRIFNKGGEPCLIDHFDKLFQTSEFNFRISTKGHVDIMEALADVDIEDIHSEKDLLGWVYEQHLSKGSSSARDLGQFFTDRPLCHYMTTMCAPKRLASGEIESVCDPSMGTGGFLTTAIQYYRGVVGVKNEEWKSFNTKIHGCDIDRFVSSVSAINCFIETHGTAFPHVGFRNSIADDLVHPTFDIILANMPFGVKGLKHDDCCKRVRDLKISGGKSEPLFLQLMMVSLNPGGRCAVVVPDGMLVNTSKLHNGTRKYLLDHFEVRRIVKMKGQFFMNTGIQPSVIFFENTGKPTTVVEFWEATKTDKGEITDTMLVSVHREKFDATFSFDMRRYLESEKPLANPAGFPMVMLSDVCEYSNGKTLASSDKIEDGEYDVMGGGMEYIGKTSKYNREGETVSISKSGASAGFVAYHNKKYWAGDCLTLVTNDNTRMKTKYLYYFMKLNSHLTMSKTSGSTIPHCKWDDIKNILIIVPPLPIQQEIVATLDRIYQPGTTELADTLKMTDKAMDLVLANPAGVTLEPIIEAQRLIRKSAQMVADVKAQMVAIMKSVESRGFPTKSLEYLCNVENGKIPKADHKTDEGIYPIMGGGLDYNGKSSKWNRDGQFISISKSGSSSGFVKFHDCKFWAGDCMTLSCSEFTTTIIIHYLYYYLKSIQKQIQGTASGSAIPHCNWKNISIIEIPLPPIDFQHSLIARLDALQSQLTALETLQKHSEDNARFILESYLAV